MCRYSGDMNMYYQTSEKWNHLNTEQIEIQYSNGLVFRCTVPENQSSEYRTGFQMVEAFLAAILLQPSEYWSCFQMVTILTTTYSSPDKLVRYSNGPVIRCLVQVKIDHSNTGLVRYSDPHCTRELHTSYGKIMYSCFISFACSQLLELQVLLDTDRTFHG
jgi:hypothetical protein